MLARLKETKMYFPEHQKDLLDEGETTNVIFYNESTQLPLGLRAVRSRAEEPIIGDYHLDEMELISGEQAFVGDMAHGHPDGSIAFPPEDIVPEPEERRVRASLEALDRALGKEVHTIFCGHGSDVVGRYAEDIGKKKIQLQMT